MGSSSFVTDEKGKVYEHLEYFPFGETFAHEHSNTQVTPYRFTGKEYDEVTGLYYYGARYYAPQGHFLASSGHPRTSVWQSPDPILDQYMSGQTNGGVFNSKNLSLMSYTYNNPVNLSDPDGNNPLVLALAPEAISAIEAGVVALAATLGGMLGIEAIKNNGGGIVGGGFQISDDYGMDHSTTLPAYDDELGSFSAFPSSDTEINIGGFDTDGPSGASASIFPASNDNAAKVYLSNTDKLNLNKQLASKEQLSELNNGMGRPIAGSGTDKKLRDAQRLSAQYGGKPGDWAKVRSSNRKHSDGFNQETHAYQNTKTNEVVEHKTKLEGH